MIEDSIKDNRFILGAGTGFCIGLLFYAKARYFSQEAKVRRLGDHLALSRLLDDQGRLSEAFASLQLAGKDNPALLIELGDAFNIGRGTEVNPQKAYECYLEAYEKGQSPYHLAMALHEGRGCIKSQAKAFELFVKAAMRGEIVAYRKLADLYLEDTPLGISKLKSLFYTRSAVLAGSSESEEVFNRHCIETGRGLMDAELDTLTDQIGQTELDAVAVMVRQEEERREEEQLLLKLKLMKERREEEERLERERILWEEQQRILQQLDAELQKTNLVEVENEQKQGTKSVTEESPEEKKDTAAISEKTN